MKPSLFKKLISIFLDHAENVADNDGSTELNFDGMLEREEPLTFTYNSQLIRAWVYLRYNGTEVLHIETDVGMYEDSPAVHRFVATNCGRLPFATVRVDPPNDYERLARVVCTHSLVATEATSAVVGEVLDGITYNATRARERLICLRKAKIELTCEGSGLSLFMTESDDEVNDNGADDESDEADDIELPDDLGDSITDDSDKFDEVKIAKVHGAKADDTTDKILAELDALVGLGPVKSVVHELAATHEIDNLRRGAGLAVVAPSPHLVFTGNPGTGKTTVARLVGRLYKSLGMLEKGHVIETDRSGLVGAYIGQTALKTKKTCESALGGILFIDEAYALVGDQRDYGIEAIEALLTFMEMHRGEFAVVVAGYPTQMDQFIASNPGVRSRFDMTINFPDFTDEELSTIFTNLAGEFDYTLDDDARDALNRVISAMPRRHGFGNGREMRKLFNTAVRHQAQLIHANIGGSDDDMNTSLLRRLTAEAIGDATTVRAKKKNTNWGYL